MVMNQKNLISSKVVAHDVGNIDHHLLDAENIRTALARFSPFRKHLFDSIHIRCYGNSSYPSFRN